MKWPTASKMGLALNCCYPWNSGLEWPFGESSEAAKVGTLVHKIIELNIRNGQADRLGITRAHGLGHRFGDIEALTSHALEQVSLFSRDVEPEVSFYHCPSMRKTGRCDAYASAPDGSLCGTADIVEVNGVPAFVADWKTGREVELARDSIQLRFLAFCIWQSEIEVERVRATIYHLQPEGMTSTEWCYDNDELDNFGEQLAALSERLNATPAPMPGDHCTDLYCPLRTYCPATNKVLSTIIPDGEKLSIEIHDAKHAAWTLHRLAAVKDAISEIDGALRHWADQHGGIEREDGKVWGPNIVERESIELSNTAVLALLDSDIIDLSELEQMAPRKLTKAALKRYLSAADARAAMQVLDDAGAIRRKVTTRYEARKRVSK